MKHRTQVLNNIIKDCGFTKYLEIGIDKGENYPYIECDNKLGVDPNPVYQDGETIINTTSDRFFSLLSITNPSKKFDLIFIDGLHHAEQCSKDMVNSLRFLAEGGMIVVHDVNPSYEAQQKVPRTQNDWTGDVWRAFIGLKQVFDEHEVLTLDVETGLGIIRPDGLKGINTELLLRDPWAKINDTLSFQEFYERKPEILKLEKYL